MKKYFRQTGDNLLVTNKIQRSKMIGERNYSPDYPSTDLEAIGAMTALPGLQAHQADLKLTSTFPDSQETTGRCS